MPVKRRTGKAARLSDYHREQLRDGPEDHLLAGVGYMEGHASAVFSCANDAEKALILEQMRSDWARHGVNFLAEWRDAGIRSPWALETFGRP